MQKLMLKKEFIQKLDSVTENIRILTLYGYKNGDAFLKAVIERLNQEYSYLDISGYEEMPRELEKIYHTYNGYIAGELREFKEITVSFSHLQGKEGNTIITQDLMPMLQQKIENDVDYMFKSEYKHIFLLSTHKSSMMDREKNEIEKQSSSTIQMLVKCLNNMNFDVIPIIPIKNLTTDNRYYSINELIDNLNYLTKSNSANNQHIAFKKTDNLITAEILDNPKGQEQKYFAFRYLALLMLNDGYRYDFSRTIQKCSDNQIKTLNKLTDYINKTNKTLLIKDIDEGELEISIDVEESKTTDVNEEPIFTISKSGRRRYKTRKNIKDAKLKECNYICECNDEKHLYFTSESTNENYVEGHHIIPMEFQRMYWEDKKKNLDVAQNIVPLCPHCHKKIHHAIKEQRMEIIKNLYEKNKQNLIEIDPQLTIETLATYYNIY